MALAVVQHTSVVGAANANTQAITVTSTGANNLLAVAGMSFEAAGGRTVTGVSDGTNNFTQVASAAAAGSGTTAGQATDVWYLPKSTSGKTTITVTYSGAAGAFDKEIVFWEVSGFTNPITNGAATVPNGTGASNTDTGATVTTTATTGFVVAGIMVKNSITANPKAGNEFTSGGDITGNSNAGCSLISSTAAAHTPVWTDSAAAGGFTTSTAAFREAPWAQVQGKGTNQTGTAVFTSNVVSGNLLIVDIWIESTTGTVSAISDTLGTSYVAATGYGQTTNKGRSISYIGLAPSSGANTVTITTTAGVINTNITEMSENTTGPSTTVDVLGTVATGSTATPTSSSITTTASGDLLWGTVVDDLSSYSSGLTAGWALGTLSSWNENFRNFYSLANAASPGSYSFTTTYAAGAQNWVAQIFAIKVAGGGAAPLLGSLFVGPNLGGIVG